MIASNCRPISLLSIFSTITEKYVYQRFYNFLLQFGFRAIHSVNHALISMTESIKNSLDNKKFGCGIFLDLQRFF